MQAMRQSPVAGSALNSQGGLNVRYLPQIFRAIGMSGRIWTGPPSNPPDISFIKRQLQISYLLGCYQVAGGSHFVVISGLDDTHIYFFNPWSSIGNSKIKHTLVRSAPLIIGWKP